VPPLADLQHSFCRALLTGTAPALAFAPGRVPAAAALEVHRNTVIGALVGALRLSYPSVDRLVGEEFFDHAAAAFVEVHPPTVARLTGYGEDFAVFVQNLAPSLPYLRDVARLDWTLERVLLAPGTGRRFVLDESACVILPASLVSLRLDHPAAEIRASLEDDAALAAIDLSPAPRGLLAWRDNRHAMLRPAALSTVAFISALFDGQSTEAALAVASDAPPDTVMQALQNDIFAAPFCQVIQGELS